MVDRPLTPSSSEISDVLAGYGLGGDSRVATPRPPSDEDADVLRGYGVTLKPGQSTTAPEPKFDVPPENKVDLSKARPGKVNFNPDYAPPTKQDVQKGMERGLGAQFVSGIPVLGPSVNLLTAYLDPDRTGAPANFDQRFFDQKMADRAFSLQHPYLSAGANLAGGTLGYYGLSRLPLGIGNALMGAEGPLTPSLATRLYGGVAGGAGVNALDAGLRHEDPIQAGVVGGVTGFAGPLTGEIARAGTSSLLNSIAPRPTPLQGVPRAGINLLTDAMRGETDASIAAGRSRMGSNGFLADLNHGLGDLAGGIADMSGPEKQIVQEAYRNRLAEQPKRIDNALTQATGMRGDFDITKYEKFLTESRKVASDPLYQQFRDTKVYPTPELKDLIPRLEKVGAFDEAEFLSGATGTPINRKFFTGGPQKDYPTTETWDLIKRGLDSKIEQALSSGNKTRASALMNLKGEMIGEIEKTNAGQVWKQARQEFASRSALIDQLNAGRDTFLGSRSGLSVDELRQELSHLSGPELAARVAGMRKAVAEAMGDKTEAAGQVRNKLLAPNNQEKLRLMLAGQPGGADELINKLQSEKYLSDRTPAIIPNMNTGASGQTRAERRALFDVRPSSAAEWIPDLDLTHPLNVIPAPLHPGNALQDIRAARAARVAPALAPILLTPEGPKMDALINALKSEGARQSAVNEGVYKYFANPLSRGVAGPGQLAYRRYLEDNQQK